MGTEPERRRVMRVDVPRHLRGGDLAPHFVRLLDLSVAGARIEHLAVLRLGAMCALELPPPGRACTLPAHVVWCTIVGRKQQLGGESHLVARSGLRFPTLTAPQHAALTEALHHLATDLQPIA